MPVCPIDTGRYGSGEMKALFEEDGRIQRYLDVEAALAEALAEEGEIPVESAKVIREKASVKIVTPQKVKDREKKTHHDLMALVEVLAEEAGEHGKYVHWGATSYDIVDTSWSLIARDGLSIIRSRMRRMRDLLCEMALKHKGTVMVGRTHGQHATPITLGLKMAVYAAEAGRNLQRLKQIEERLIVGKMSGAVGTMASQGEKAMKIEERLMGKLGLRPAEVTTQVICRDRFAEFICWAAIAASSLDRIATEIRNLQRTEIQELAEGFETSTQVGSSTMPHKQNPVDCEKVSGLAKVMRGLVVPALENIPLWHERDLTDSSSERFIIPMSFIILDEMLMTLTRVIENMRVYPERMARNLLLMQGANLSESVMMALAKKGIGRQKAHELLRAASMRSVKENLPLLNVLRRMPEITSVMSEAELAEKMKPENYIGKAHELVDRAVAFAKEQ